MSTANVRFMTNNFLGQDEYDQGRITFSSEETSFPGTNALDQRRTVFWQPDRSFEIHANNKDFDFWDGANQTIELTEGNYSISTIASQIQADLNATSSGWAVSYDVSLGIFKFENSANPTWRLRMDSGSGFWPLVGLLQNFELAVGPTGISSASAAFHGSEWIEIDMGISVALQFAAMIVAVDEVFTVTQSGSVFVQASDTGNFADPELDITISRTDAGAFGFFNSEGNQYRYYRLGFKDPTNSIAADTNYRIGHVYLGTYQQVTSSNVGIGFNKEIVDRSKEFVAFQGTKYYEQQPRFYQFNSLQINNLERNERLDLEQTFYSAGTFTPFYISFDPELNISNDISELTRYVRFLNEPSFQHIIRDYYLFQFEVDEVV